tara:strand:+ start:505 stop:897 length:393 start_codon:yes stop_codon:yes gene_type:complete
MSHHCSYRVYYEDTDAGGVVYYANYLKFAERARTEWLRERGIIQSKLAQEEDILFVVRKAELDLKQPARLDDLIDIETSLVHIKGARINLEQTLCVNKQILVSLNITIACINSAFKPTRLPPSIINAIAS